MTLDEAVAYALDITPEELSALAATHSDESEGARR
jgi:hypothetical protein